MQVNSNNLFFPFSNNISSSDSNSLNNDPYLSRNPDTLNTSLQNTSAPSYNSTQGITQEQNVSAPISYCFDAGCNCGLPKKSLEMVNTLFSNSASTLPNPSAASAPSNYNLSLTNSINFQGQTSTTYSTYSSDSYSSAYQTNQFQPSSFALPYGVPVPFLPPQLNQNFNAPPTNQTESIEKQNKLQLKLQQQRNLKKKQKQLEAQKKEEAKKQKKKELKKRKNRDEVKELEGDSSHTSRKHKTIHLMDQPHINFPYTYQYDLNFPLTDPHQFSQFFNPNLNFYAVPNLSQPNYNVPFNPQVLPGPTQAPILSAPSFESLNSIESNQTNTISSLFTDIVSNPNEASVDDDFAETVHVPIQNRSFHGNLSPIHTPIASTDGSFTFDPLSLPPPSHTIPRSMSPILSENIVSSPRSMTPPILTDNIVSSTESIPKPLPTLKVKKKRKIIIRKASRRDSSLASTIETSASFKKNKLNYLQEESLSSKINTKVKKRTLKVDTQGSEGEASPHSLTSRVSKISKRITSVRRRQTSKVARTTITNQPNLNFPMPSISLSQDSTDVGTPPLLQSIEPTQHPIAPLLSIPPLNASKVKQFNRSGARMMHVSRPSVAPLLTPTPVIPTPTPSKKKKLKAKLNLENVVIYESPEDFINKINLIMNSIPSQEDTFEMRIDEFKNKLCSSLKYENGKVAIENGARIIMKKNDATNASFYCLFYKGPFSSEGLKIEAFNKFGIADKHYHIEFYEAQDNNKPDLERPPCIHMRISKFHGELSWLEKGKSVSGTEVANFYKVFKNFLKIPMIVFDDAQIKMPHNSTNNYYLKVNAIFDPDSKTWYQKLLDIDVININQWPWKQTKDIVTQNRKQYYDSLQFIREYPISQFSKILDNDHLRSITDIAKKAFKIPEIENSNYKIKDFHLRVYTLAKEAIKGNPDERIKLERNLYDLQEILFILPNSNKLKELPYWKAIDVLVKTRIFCSGVADLNVEY